MGNTPMKIVCEYPSGTLRVAATINDIPTLAIALKNFPGIGLPFLIFTTLPTDPVTMADFDLHSDWAGYGNVVTDDRTKNEAMINAMLAAPPLDALTF